MPDDQSSYQPKIPEAVRRQAARAEELSRLAAGGSGGEPQGEEGANVQGATTVGENQGTEQEHSAKTGESQESNNGPATRTTPEPGAREIPGNQDTNQDTNWQQRYQTLQGKYSAEVPRLTAQVRASQDQIQQMQQLIATMRSAPAPTPPSARSAPAQPRIAPEDIEAYGEDLVTATRRWARAEVDSEIQQLRGQVEQLSSRSQQTETSLAQRSVEQTLDAEVANWRAINNDAAFSDWLALPDPFSGRRRHDMLGEAYSSGDGPRTSAFFKAYLREQTVTDPASNSRTHTPPSAGVSLEQLAAPGRGPTTSPASGGAQNIRLWSRDQITAFYQEKSLGKWDNREAEAARVDQDIFAAAAEGRIR